MYGTGIMFGIVVRIHGFENLLDNNDINHTRFTIAQAS